MYGRNEVRHSTIIIEALGKRLSTATPIQHEMWLISLDTFLTLYGKLGNNNVMDVHQDLKQQNLLIQWQDVPSDGEIVFVSHEWLSWAHPDPEGHQLRVLCCALERLRDGKVNRVDMDPLHTIAYKHNFTTTRIEWQDMLRKTYLWIDWISMPQPSADKYSNQTIAKLRADSAKAIRSIPAYVERSDFILILAPGCNHTDRNTSTCFRTWRRRGWCLLELFASFMARDSTNPPLVIKSARGTPMWMSPLEIHKLSIGYSDFSCCQRNHVITTETQKIMMNDDEVKKIPCDRPIVKRVLKQLIDAKVNYLFNTSHDIMTARMFLCLKGWWLRGLHVVDSKNADQMKEIHDLKTFKAQLRWEVHEK